MKNLGILLQPKSLENLNKSRTFEESKKTNFNIKILKNYENRNSRKSEKCRKSRYFDFHNALARFAHSNSLF